DPRWPPERFHNRICVAEIDQHGRRALKLGEVYYYHEDVVQDDPPELMLFVPSPPISHKKDAKTKSRFSRPAGEHLINLKDIVGVCRLMLRLPWGVRRRDGSAWCELTE
ncbi:MAG: hypothetical protein N2C14_06315, partial [Planctomycetales bacterium]